VEDLWSRKHLCGLSEAREGPARLTGTGGTDHAAEVCGCLWTLGVCKGFFCPGVVGIASFPAAGSVRPPVTKTTSTPAHYRVAIQGKMDPDLKGFDFFSPKPSGDSLLPVQINPMTHFSYSSSALPCERHLCKDGVGDAGREEAASPLPWSTLPSAIHQPWPRQRELVLGTSGIPQSHQG